jgi:Ca2+:H+ antiporter
MHALLREIRHNRLLWLLVFVPVVFAAQRARPEAQTLLFLLSVLAIVPLAALSPPRRWPPSPCSSPRR